MKTIGHCLLAYRGDVKVETAFSVARDAIWAASNGYAYNTWYIDCSSIERARNRCVMIALHQKVDYLVMQDADCYVLPSAPGSLLGQCLEPMLEAKAAACGAAFVCRGLDKMNVEPARPGEVYEGEVGTGFMVIDMNKLSAMPMPWFEFKLNDIRTETELGEDVGFCRKVKEHGHKVLVNYAIGTGHGYEGMLRCHPAEIAEGQEDILRVGDKRFQLVTPS